MQQVATVQEAVKLCGKQVYVAVDIGGTNARVAVMDAARGASGGVMVVKKTNVMKDMLAFLQDFETELMARGWVTVVGAAVAGPGPRNAAGTQLGPFSNYTAECRVLNMADLPKRLFPAGKTAFMNDLESAAYGIAAVSQDGRFPSMFKKMWGPQDGSKMHLDHGPYLVLAVGTGCGTGLVHLVDGKVTVMPLEFGHTSIVPEKADQALLDSLAASLYKNDKPAEYEDIVAGRGLVRAYMYYRETAKAEASTPALKDAGDVAACAKKGCKIAADAMWVHYKYLIHLASDLAMGFVLGGVVLAGDNVLYNEFFVSQPDVQRRLETHFKSHTMERMGFQSRVDVFRQTQKFSLNIEGAFYKAREAALGGRAKL
eukprot:TRINITY_DN3065_c1_g2_i1.p1 TRINITY_DN3065_c1_g2~~TRINITY_DN3065_c1_g2_i1.p1  ORF type:complete len:371 (+),score=125.34 TRINITY_DN3065_c1_g2_i1:60-1172(+)